MFKDNICIILARSGSKGIKNKNIQNFHGKELIYYTIKPIIKSGIFKRIIVSTDSDIIAKIANKYGAESPFKRPKKYSTDKSYFYDALHHALKWVEKNDRVYDNVLYTYPTNPLRVPSDFKKASKLLSKKIDLVCSVSMDSHPIFWSNVLKKNHSLKGFVKKKYCKNRQELPITYHVDGSIFFGRWDTFYNKKNFYEVNSKAMIFDKARSVDIDDYDEFEKAKIIYKKLNIKNEY